MTGGTATTTSVLSATLGAHGEGEKREGEDPWVAVAKGNPRRVGVDAEGGSYRDAGSATLAMADDV